VLVALELIIRTLKTSDGSLGDSRGFERGVVDVRYWRMTRWRPSLADDPVESVVGG